MINYVMSHLGDDQVSQIAAQFGTDPAQAHVAIEHTVSLIVGGVTQNANTPQGASALNCALGANQAAVLTPIVMAALANHAQAQDGLNPSGLSSILSQANQQTPQQGGVLGGLGNGALNHQRGNFDLSQVLGGALGGGNAAGGLDGLHGALTGRGLARMRRFARIAPLVLVLLACVLPAHADTFIVNVGGDGNVFNPQTLSIQPGDTVAFINKGGYHNVVADDGSFRCAHGCDGDGHGGNGSASSMTWVVSLTFPTPGTIGYFCEIHGAPGERMYGTITVAAPPPGASAIPVGGWMFGALLACTLIVAASAQRRARKPRR